MATAMSNGNSIGSELIRGRDSAARLAALLQEISPAGHEAQTILAETLLCFDGALASLGSKEEKTNLGGNDGSKKRKLQSDSTRRCKQRSSNPCEIQRVERKNTTEDGYTWRKYGHKDILNCKYPRCYYRCTYKYEQNCQAIRQVQQSEEDPSIYVITYMGEHTCTDAIVTEKPQPFSITFGPSDASSTKQQGVITFSSLSWQSVKQENSCNEEVRSVIVDEGCSSSEISHVELQDEVAFENLTLMTELLSSESEICHASPSSQSSGCSLDGEFGDIIFDLDNLLDLDQFDIPQTL